MRVKNLYFCSTCEEETISIFTNVRGGVSVRCEGKCDMAISFAASDVLRHCDQILADFVAAATEAVNNPPESNPGAR